MPEDRPNKEEIERDDLFDKWLVAYDRKQKQEASLRKGKKVGKGAKVNQ